MCVFNYFTSLIIKENKLHSYPHISVTRTSKSKRYSINCRFSLSNLNHHSALWETLYIVATYMSDFRENMQSLRASQAFTELGVNMEMVKHFAELKPSMLEYFNPPNFSLATPLAHEQPELLAGCSYNNSFSNFQTYSPIVVPRVHTVRGNEDVLYESSRRKVTEQSTSISKTMCSSASTSEIQGHTYKNKKIVCVNCSSSKFIYLTVPVIHCFIGNLIYAFSEIKKREESE